MSPSSRNKRPGEFALIAKYFAPLATSPAALGLKDDAARLSIPAGEELIVTADAIVEGVHFLRSDPPGSIAQKALRVNISDLAAKGARPLGYLMTLSLPDRIGRDWLKAFVRGLALDQRTFGIALLGGDTTSTPGPLSIAITALGSTRKGRMIERAGARPGDLVFVTGTIGDAGMGLSLLRRGRGASAKVRRLVGRYRVPEPRLALGTRLGGVAHAALDISDGLVADLGHIASSSGVRIVLDAGRIPLSPDYASLSGSDDRAILRAATSGDDYEIAFTAAPAARKKIAALSRATKTQVTEIGTVVAGRGVVLLGRRGRALAAGKGGYTHF